MVVFYIHPKETLREDTCLHSHCGGIWGPGETSTHRSEIEPPLLTFGHRAVRMGGPARTLCPPGKEKSRISYIGFERKKKNTKLSGGVSRRNKTTHSVWIHTHTISTHHMPTVLWKWLGFVSFFSQVLVGHKGVSFSLVICQKQMRCGTGRQCSWEKPFICNSHPRRRRSRESSHNNNSDNEDCVD